MAVSFEEARSIAAEIGYPVLVRPSYVLGGRGMQIVYDDEALRSYIEAATEISNDRPVLVDRFIDDAVEIDVDALYDGHELYLGGVMEHIEEAGIHSGDSSCALPPITLGDGEIRRIRTATEAIAKGIGVRGLINIQFAWSSDVLYVLEANPRASRTVPFVSKATAVPLAKAAARVMMGETVAGLRAASVLPLEGDGGTLPADQPIAVKEAVMPFNRFRSPDGKQVDTVLGPEMKSTGEVMGFDADFGTAFAKAQTAAFGSLPTRGKVFVSMANRDKRTMIFPIKVLADQGFEILATQGTAEALRRNGVRATVVRKHWEGESGRAVLGGVKSTVGHLLTGAGAAGLAKVLLAFREMTLPPTANFERPNPKFGYESSPFRVLTRAEPWEATGPRRAAINGFGFLQIVRPRRRASLPELLRADPVASAALALLRAIERTPPPVPPVQSAGPRVAAWLTAHPELVDELSRRTGAPISFTS